jgi:hypothetical protein
MKRVIAFHASLASVLIFLLIAVVSIPAFAESVEYIGEKPFDCDNPTALVNDDPITAIDRVEIYIVEHPEFTAADSLQTILMPGGCDRIPSVDITPSGIGQRYQRGIAFLENGGESALSDPLPFILMQSPPNPPVMTE